MGFNSMKRKTRGAAIRLLVIVILLTFCLPGCWSSREKDYYSNQSNFISVTGTVSKITYGFDCLYLCFDELSESFDDTSFKMITENLAIAKSNGIDELKVGDNVTFVSAPGLYSNGYYFPIVALSMNDMVYLPFEDGYANFMYKQYGVMVGK